MTELMPLLKSTARYAFHRSGALYLVRLQKQHGIRILMYHRFDNATRDPRRLLRAQCTHLRRHYNLVSLTEIVGILASGQSPPPNCLAVTVDDGYEDFYDVAYPVFTDYQIPVTVFLVTDFLDRKDWLWVDKVQYAFAHCKLPEVEVELGAVTSRFRLDSAQDRNEAAHTLTEMAKRVRDDVRLKLISDLPAITAVRLPDEVPPEFSALAWDSIREMGASGISFGAHTVSHPILSRITDPQTLRHELGTSKGRIEQEIQRPVDHFCYPNGGQEDISSEAVQVVRELGYRTAVTALAGLNHAGQNLWLLKRIGVDPEIPELYFRERAAGFRVESSESIRYAES